MTYTNAAVKVIEDRVNHNNLIISTIHDFFWDNIKSLFKKI
jgi:DNA helicase-2/ATP-dependent DNA helicase PcrA